MRVCDRPGCMQPVDKDFKPIYIRTWLSEKRGGTTSSFYDLCPTCVLDFDDYMTEGQTMFWKRVKL